MTEELKDFNKDIEFVKERYGMEHLFYFDDLFNRYKFYAEEEQIQISELKKFLEANFDEINMEFTLKINEFENNKLEFDEFTQTEYNLKKDYYKEYTFDQLAHDLKNLCNYRTVCFTLDKNKGLVLCADQPCFQSVRDTFAYIIAKKWEQLKKQKVKIYIYPMEHLMVESDDIGEVYN